MPLERVIAENPKISMILLHRYSKLACLNNFVAYHYCHTWHCFAIFVRYGYRFYFGPTESRTKKFSENGVIIRYLESNSQKVNGEQSAHIKSNKSAEEMTSRRSPAAAAVAQNHPILVYFASPTYFISYPPARAADNSFSSY